jgi:ABC-type nitrate/sulfonate/bicarbonate transport system substrate-binding protein
MSGRRAVAGRWLAAAMLAFLAALPARAAERPTIRIGWVAVPAELQPLLFAKPGVSRHVHQSYELDVIRFAGTPAMITALAAGELDIAPLAYSSFGTAVEKARMTDLRIIADEFQDGAPGHYTNEYMVLKDSAIRTVEDLKGKVVASNAIGSALDIGLRAMLRRHGLEDRKDYTLVEVNFANMKSVLIDRKVDLICAVVPFVHDPELRAIARPLFTQAEAIGRTQMTMWVARAGYIEKTRAALVDFLEDYLRELRWYTDPKNQAEAIEIVARLTKLPPERFTPWLYTSEDHYRDPRGLPDLEVLQKNMETQRELGFLKAAIEVTTYADLSLIKEAGERLER